MLVPCERPGEGSAFASLFWITHCLLRQTSAPNRPLSAFRNPPDFAPSRFASETLATVLQVDSVEKMPGPYTPPQPAALSLEEPGAFLAISMEDAEATPIPWRQRLSPRVRRGVYILETRDVNVIDRILFWSALFWVLAALWEA